MTCKGTVRGGVVVLEPGAELPEGATVEVRPVTESDQNNPTLYERLKDVIGIAEGLPEDMAANHDHYIHGTPKGVDQS